MVDENKYLTSTGEDNEEFDLNALVEEVLTQKYDHKAPVPKRPEYIISVGGRGIALPASLIGVYGPPKSRKSSFMGMLAAACLAKDGKYEHIETSIKGDILWFDTEQNETEVKYFQDNIIRMSGVVDDDEYLYGKYYGLKLRPYDELQRLAIIDKIVTSPQIFDNIGLIVLDGVADLMYNVNEIEASKKLVTRLTYWADKLQVPVIVALHTNKDGKDATGSLGGFLNKKASYAIKCEAEYEGGPSTVRPYYTRNGQGFLPFTIDNHGEDSEFPGMPKLHNGGIEGQEYQGSFMNTISKKPRVKVEPEVHHLDQGPKESFVNRTSDKYELDI